MWDFSRCLGLPALVAVFIGSSLAAAQSGGGQARKDPSVLTVAVSKNAQVVEPAARAAQILEQAVGRSTRFEGLKLVDALDPVGARARQARLREGEALYTAGMQFYDDLDTQKASAQFDRAIRSYESIDLSRYFGKLVQAWTMKIASLIANGEVKAAELEMERLLPLEPELKLLPAYFPPDALARAEKIRKGMSRSFALQVKSTPSGAQVFLDGRYQGTTPLALNQIANADHYLTVALPGYVLHQQRARDGLIEVGLRRAEKFSVYSAALSTLTQNPRPAERDAALQRLAQGVDASQVLVATVDRAPSGRGLALSVLRVDASDGHNLNQRVVKSVDEKNWAAEVEQSAALVLAKDEPRSGGAAHKPDGLAPGGESVAQAGWTNRKTAYVLWGAAGVLALGTTYFGLNALHNQAEYSKVHTRPTLAESDKYAAAGRRSALVADIFGVVALGSAVTGGYFFWFAPEKRAEGTP